MEYTDRIFNHVQYNYPEVWKQILQITKLHNISSIKKIFNEHLKHVKDITIFNEHEERIPLFLLKFCEAIQRNFLTPGDSYGTLVTCRSTKIYTQDTLDKRHLKEQNNDFANTLCFMNKNFNFEMNIYTSLNQIYEVTNKRKYTTIFVKNYTVQELLEINPSETCYLSAMNAVNKATTINHRDVYFNLKNFIITESFIPGYLKIIQKSEHKSFFFKHINQFDIVAFTDLKYIYEKCGLICYFFNLINVLKLQFFKTMNAESKEEKDIINILRYQCYTGKMLPINRNGLKKNINRSGLDKLCFEAIKQNYALESVKNNNYPVNSSIDKMFFGQQFNVGTGYNFALMPKIK